MNPDNYCTLPIAKRLHEAGILNREPEIGDRVSINDSSLGEGFIVAIDKHGAMPAYRVELDTGGGYWGDSDQLVILHSLAEVWQELPDGVCLNKSDLCGNYISVLLLILRTENIGKGAGNLLTAACAALRAVTIAGRRR